MVDISTTGYWLPEDLRKRTYDYILKMASGPEIVGSRPSELKDIFVSVLNKTSLGGIVYDFIHKYSQHDIMQFLKLIGYPKEIYQRAMLEFRYKTMEMVGWYNDPKTWKHLFLERMAEPDLWKNWTQEQTKIAVTAIKEVVEAP